MSPRLAFALDAALKAGKSTLAHFQTGTPVETKSDHTPVTIADKNAERLVRELIEKHYPGDHVLGEEEGGDHTKPNRWVLDPIDGTKSFVSGVPLYATLLSYEENFQPILGVAYFPALDELLYAERGQGAFFNGRPARVSNKPIKGGVVCCGGHRTLLERNRWEGFKRLIDRAMASRTWGDAYGHALVATGRVEAMIDPSVSRWDLSAVAVIVEEAGGRFTRFDGSPVLTADTRLEAISTNAVAHQTVLRAFQP